MSELPLILLLERNSSPILRLTTCSHSESVTGLVELTGVRYWQKHTYQPHHYYLNQRHRERETIQRDH